MRAVVCDDDELVRELLASALTRASVDVVGEAGSAPDAIHLVEILKPDLLLLDEVMPGMGGIEAMPAILAAAPHCLVVLVTAMPLDPDVALLAGAYDVIHKDLGVGQLAEVLDRIRAETGERGVASPARVAVVDDDVALLELLRQAFEVEGFEVLLAANGADGLELVRAHHPDVVVLDILLPDIDGLQVLSLLKDDPRTLDVPVLVLSAKSDSVAIDFAIRVGAVDWLVKPCDPLDLVRQVRALLPAPTPT